MANKNPIIKHGDVYVVDRKVLRRFLPRLKELSKTSKAWYWLYQCAKQDNLRKAKKAHKAFWRAWEREQREE